MTVMGLVTIATQKTQPQVPKPTQTVDPSCAQHVKSPRQPIRTPVTSSPIPSNNRQNWNQRMQRDLGAGYSFERKPCFVCGSLSHLIKNCDYYEKKMAREAALKSQRVNHANVRQASPAWTNINRVNKANQFTPRPVNIRPNLSTATKSIKTSRVNVNTGHEKVNSGSMHVNAGTQVNSGASRFNTGKQHVNSGRMYVNSGTQNKSGGSRVNTGKQNVNTARVNRPVLSNQTSQVNLKSPKKCFSKQSSPVNRPFSRNTAYKSNIYAVKGKMGTAVCVWRKTTPHSNTNSGPTPDSYVHDHPLKHMEHRGIFDSGCSGHMTGNRAHLEDYQELSKVGSVTFGGSKGFAEIVDFLRGSNLRYALTANPTIYDSLVKQFWQSAIASTKEDGFLEISATIDTIRYTITEASIRESLQLDDATGITMLPNDDLFQGMGQIGYPTDGTFTFWKSFFTPQWRYLVHHLLHCISSKSGGWDQFGSNIATALICLSTGRVYNFSKLIFDGMMANLKNKKKFLMEQEHAGQAPKPNQYLHPQPIHQQHQTPLPTLTSPPATIPSPHHHLFLLHIFTSPIHQQHQPPLPTLHLHLKLSITIPTTIPHSSPHTTTHLRLNLQQWMQSRREQSPCPPSILTITAQAPSWSEGEEVCKGSLKRRKFVLTDSEDEELRLREKSQSDPQDYSKTRTGTPLQTKGHASRGGNKRDEISSQHLEAAKKLSQRFASLKQVNCKGGVVEVNAASIEVNTASKVNTGSIELNTVIEQDSTAGENKALRSYKIGFLQREEGLEQITFGCSSSLKGDCRRRRVDGATRRKEKLTVITEHALEVTSREKTLLENGGTCESKKEVLLLKKSAKAKGTSP
ncbi:hypothetical protein Tco_1475292 [Tanacetum coccineum]